MEIRDIGIVGPTGFIGAALCEQLTGRGKRLRAITRRAAHARRLLVFPTVEVREADPHDEERLTRHFEGLDAVVNLVGILHETGGRTFQSAHVDLPRRLVNACRAAGVARLIHVSALGASEAAPSEYLRSKALGEKAVREGAGDALAVTVLRPSVVFGLHDLFLNRFAAMARLFPVIPLPAAGARMQPVWVRDVARAIATSLESVETAGRAYALCGPRAYTLEEIVGFVATLVGRRPWIVPLPAWAAQLQAAVFERLPGHLVTRDNLRSLSVDNVSAEPFPEAFGFLPASMEAIVPAYLADARLKGRFGDYRYRAGR